MRRRSFIKNAAFSAVAISTSGFIHFNGKGYVGDCETTTDIIGPFYRPDSPVRNNFIIKGEPGTPVELSGIIKHNDCTTPYKKAKIELWHCDNSGLYDNESDQFRYRGTTFSDDNGHYIFNTILPIAYNVSGGPYRPAHFHLMITAEGYQPLITQLYFTGDPYLTKDPYSNSQNAKKRILEVQIAQDGKKKVLYDVSMAEKLNVEPASLDKLTGVYTNEDDKTITCEFFIRNNRLWYNAVYGKKLDPYGRVLDYIDNNTFRSPGSVPPIFHSYVFEIQDANVIKCTETFINSSEKKYVLVFFKGK
jgi:catechol 1,2-dioxygenase